MKPKRWRLSKPALQKRAGNKKSTKKSEPVAEAVAGFFYYAIPCSSGYSCPAITRLHLWKKNTGASIPKIPCMLRTKGLLLALVFFIRPVLSVACGNEYYTTTEMPVLSGKLNLQYLIQSRHDMELPYWAFGFGENIVERKNELFTQITGRRYTTGPVPWQALERALEKNTDYKLLSDFAWYELRVGSKSNAVRLLERLYEKYPGEYNIVANLGTAYEVTGKNEQALALLKKAVAINPQSHHGSEWIHVNILEQKVKADPDYTAILSLGSGQDYPRWLTGKTYDKPIKADSLMVQLAYQLHERISFIRPPDPVVGQLVMDFADLTAIAYSRQDAAAFYNYAVDYHAPFATTVKERMSTLAVKDVEVTVMGIRAKKQKTGVYWWLVAVPVLLAGTGAWFILRRKKKFNAQ
jgi:hypothetical protein